jgi:hypothetical protein
MPAKFRPHVDRMLGRLPMGIGGGMGNFNVRVMPPQPGEVVPKITAERILPAPLEQRIEKRFEQMNERIDKLFKMLEERRENAPRIRKTPKTDKTEGEKKPVDL